MPDTRLSNVEGCWDDFADWCNDNGVSLEHKNDWITWWNCWSNAIIAYQEKEQANAEGH